MLLYLDLAYHDAIGKGRMNSWDDLREAIVVGAVKRLRPKVMTVACMLFGLLPIMWSVGAGGDVMKRIAAPMIGGIITSFLMELIIYPPVFAIWKWNFEVNPKLKQQGPNPLNQQTYRSPDMPRWAQQVGMSAMLVALAMSAWSQTARYTVPAASVENDFAAYRQAIDSAADSALANVIREAAASNRIAEVAAKT